MSEYTHQYKCRHTSAHTHTNTHRQTDTHTQTDLQTHVHLPVFSTGCSVVVSVIFVNNYQQFITNKYSDISALISYVFFSRQPYETA